MMLGVLSRNNILTFGSATGHTWCFLHVVNLVAKLLIHQFDVSKKEVDATLDGCQLKDAAKALAELSIEIEHEDGMAGVEIEGSEGGTELDNDGAGLTR